MAKTVKEIMNAELLSVREDDPVGRALEDILAFEITAAPILDSSRRPVGVVSLRDLHAKRHGGTVGEVMTRPAATIAETDSIEHCARALADEYLHHVVVVNDSGQATGMVSALDVMCALVGRPVQHPSPFPHYDNDWDIFWSDDMLIDSMSMDAVPNGPGVLALIRGGANRAENLVWAEAVNSLPSRISELNSRAEDLDPMLVRLMNDEPELRVRVAHVLSAPKRTEIADSLMARIRGAWAPRTARE